MSPPAPASTPRRRAPLLSAAAVLLAAAPALAAPRILEHAIDAQLDPGAGRIEAEDRITVVRDGGGKLRFTLNAGLEILEARHDGRTATGLTREKDDGWIAIWSVDVTPGPGDRGEVALRYAGPIQDRVRRSEDLSFVVGDDVRGVICGDGVYLASGSGWYPDDGGMARYDARVRVPAPFLAVTQGTLLERTEEQLAGGGAADVSRWRGKYPVDGLALVAGGFRHFTRRVGDVTVGAYLTERNAAGAEVLLAETARYLDLYAGLLGPYAYDRFDVVENWFTTGYGMPEYTLLGTQVVARMLSEFERKGEIPPGYLDHEIVHCWWGNLVHPDYARGNWCEGLTSYCSNYWAKERQGPEEAAAHRANTALRFTLRVPPGKDYPLRRFTQKAEDFDDDIGYGKCSMVFHMLRREVGDEAFFGTLRRVAATHRGERLDWEGWRREFEASSSRNLEGFFAQWLDREGAPRLELGRTEVTPQSGRLLVSGTIRQVLAEGEAPWRLSVPVVVEHLEGREETVVETSAEEARFSLLVPSLPLRVSVDPGHDVFRRLADEEVPPTLAATLERPDTLVVYPDGDEALRQVAEMAVARKGGRVVAASEAPVAPPAGRSLLVFGDPQRVPLLAHLRERLPRHFPPPSSGPEVTVLASARNPADAREFVTTFVGPPETLRERARAVFYYQFDGRILFAGRAPREREEVFTPRRTSRPLLHDLRGLASEERVKATLDALTTPESAGRLAGSAGERIAREHVAEELRLAGLDVDVQPFAFAVRKLPEDLVALRRGAEAVAGAVPLVASPPTGEAGLSLGGTAGEEDLDARGRALLLDLPAGEDPLATVRQVAALARARGAGALLLRLPAEPTAAHAALFEYPNRLHPETAARLVAQAGRGGHGDPLLHAAGTAARTGSLAELPIPAVVVPHGFAATDEPLLLRVAFELHEVTSANVIGRLRSGSPRRQPGTVVLGAHLDHLGEGFAGADDNASGTAAVLEAARLLSARTELLARDVTVVFFGAEEWGLRGSRAFVAALPDRGAVKAALVADTVGRRGVEGVSVVGASHHPRIGRVVATALEQAGLQVGKDIDRFAFAHGSDHFSFHEAGIPAVDLWSGDYRVMHTREDLPEGVDAAKVTRIARALAMAVLGLAAGS